MNLTEKTAYWPVWIPFVLIIACLLIISVRFIHPGYYLVLFSASVRNINIDLYAREGLSNSTFPGILLHLNYTIILTTLIIISFWDSFNINDTIDTMPWNVFLILFVGILVFTSFRYLMLGIVKMLSQATNGVVESIYNIKVMLEISSIILTVILLIHFTFRIEAVYLQYIVLFILLFINILYWFWSFRHAMRSGISWFYLFLYLCTLEILPLVAIFMLLSD